MTETIFDIPLYNLDSNKVLDMSDHDNDVPVYDLDRNKVDSDQFDIDTLHLIIF